MSRRFTFALSPKGGSADGVRFMVVVCVKATLGAGAVGARIARLPPPEWQKFRLPCPTNRAAEAMRDLLLRAQRALKEWG